VQLVTHPSLTFFVLPLLLPPPPLLLSSSRISHPSRPVASILREVEALSEQGVKEVTLLGKP
jgi:hypothetical protein